MRSSCESNEFIEMNNLATAWLIINFLLRQLIAQLRDLCIYLIALSLQLAQFFFYSILFVNIIYHLCEPT